MFVTLNLIVKLLKKHPLDEALDLSGLCNCSFQTDRGCLALSSNGTDVCNPWDDGMCSGRRDMRD